MVAAAHPPREGRSSGWSVAAASWMLLVSATVTFAAVPPPVDWVAVTVTAAEAPICARLTVATPIAGKRSSEPHYLASGLQIGHDPAHVAATSMTSGTSVTVLSEVGTTELTLVQRDDSGGHATVEFAVDCIPAHTTATAIVFTTSATMTDVTVLAHTRGRQPLARSAWTVRTGSGSHAITMTGSGSDGAAVSTGPLASAGGREFSWQSRDRSLLVLLVDDCGAGCRFEWRRPDGVSGGSSFGRDPAIAVVAAHGAWRLRVVGAQTGAGGDRPDRGSPAVALFSPVGEALAVS